MDQNQVVTPRRVQDFRKYEVNDQGILAAIQKQATYLQGIAKLDPATKKPVMEKTPATPNFKLSPKGLPSIKMEGVKSAKGVTGILISWYYGGDRDRIVTNWYYPDKGGKIRKSQNHYETYNTLKNGRKTLFFRLSNVQRPAGQVPAASATPAPTA